MLIRTLITLILLLISTPVWAFMECVVSTDCYFLYVPTKIADGYSRDATLSIASPADDIDVCWYYEDDSTCTAVVGGSQTDTCPPGASQACLTHLGNGAYKIGIDAALVSESGKRLCVDVQDVQGTRTVADAVLCNYVYPEARNKAAWVDATWDEVQSTHTTAGTFGKYLDSQVSGAGGGSICFVSGTAAASSTTTTIVDTTNLTSTQANAYVGMIVEADGESSVIKSFNPATDTITLATALSAEPDTKTYCLVRDSVWEMLNKIRSLRR